MDSTSDAPTLSQASPSAPAVTWTPTHRAPERGLRCWAAAGDPSPLSVRLDPWLEVRVIEETGVWAQVECSNGWTTWVDGRALAALEQPSAGPPTAPPAFAARLQGALGECRAALADLEAGRVDAATCQQRLFRAGLVVEDGRAWVLDLENGHWYQYDGLGLHRLAPSQEASAGGTAG